MGDKDWRPFVYGGVASITAEFGTFPIDTTKTRLQVQGQIHDEKFTRLRYKGMIDAFMQISRQEGVKALYSGIWPAVLRQSVYGTAKFGLYYTLKKFATEQGLLIDKHGDERVWCNVLCAVTGNLILKKSNYIYGTPDAGSGTISSAIANPTDVLKVRMQVHGRGTDTIGLIGCFREIYHYEGISGLWRGVGPTAQRAAVIAAVELPVYDFCKLHLLETFGDHVANHFISSFIASLGSAVASTPIDVIRTRLMNQKNLVKTNQMQLKTTTSSPKPSTNQMQPIQIYKGSLDCGIQTVRNEGFRALYKGFIPAWLRMGPWNIIFFITYEQLKQFY